MSFSFGSPTTTNASTFGTATPSSGFSFGSGDPSKPLFGGTGMENKPAFNFSIPSTNAGSFAFGSKPMAATSSMFGSPTANTGSAFGTIKQGGFEAMMAPPNQTVGSPGFGQPVAQNAAQNLSFGGMTQQQQAPPAFGTSPAQVAPSVSFGSPSNSGFAFNKPATTSAFSFATPASGFSAPQQAATSTTPTAPQTTQSGFGATTSSTLSLGQSSAFGAKPTFTFGGGSPAAAPAFGSTPSAAPPPFGASPSGGFALPGQQTTNQATQPQTGSSFGTTTSAPLSFAGTTAISAASAFGTKPSFSTQSVLGFGSTAAPAASTAQPPLSFGSPITSTQPTAGLGFTAPASTQPNLTFGSTAGTTAPTQAPTALNFAATSAQPTGLSFTTPATSLGFATPSTLSQPAPLSFGTTASTSQPSTSLSFAPTTVSQAATGLSFAPTAVTQPAALNFGTTSAAPTPTSKVLAFGSTVAPTSQPTTGISFGTTSAPSTQSAGHSFAATTSSGLSFGAKTQASTIASSVAATSAPTGITAFGKSTATTMPSLITATTTTASVAPPQVISSITFAQLEENINKWTLELEEQEKTFINQATQINAWDRLLIANGEKIVELNDAVQTVKNEQQSLDHELDFVLAQQKELEDLLTPMEKQLLEDTGDRMRDPEREHMYTLAENLDTQLRQMSEDLKEVIEHLNETNRSQDSNDPIVQIGRILNAHMSSMQWIDNSIAQISTKLDQLKTTHDTLRRDNERSFQLTYN